MKFFIVFFCSFFCALNCYSQVDFSISVKKLSPKKIQEKLSEKKYYLINEKDKLANKKSIQIVKKVDDNFLIITKNQNNKENSIFNGELFEINNNWKLSSRILTLNKKERRVKLSLKVSNVHSFLQTASQKGIDFKKHQQYKNFLIIEVPYKEVKKLSNIYETLFLDLQQVPKHESVPIENIDLGVNNIQKAHHDFNTITGNNITISVKELLFNTEDIDLKNRIRLFGNEAEETSSHATSMATVIAGGKNSSFNSLGVAYNGTVTSSDFTNTLPDDDTIYSNHSIYIQNHSYGTEIENFYGAHANAFDQSTIDIPELLHIFSSGNMGDATPANGNYSGIEGYANMTGNFKMAKNVLVVGGVDNELKTTSLSSNGPTYDGRIKPELVAHAPNGTSDAAALVSGTAALLQQAYKEKNSEIPTSALLKAVLIAGAEDVGTDKIDFKTGYGNLNSNNSIQIIDNGFYFNDIITSNEVKEFQIPINGSTKELKIALVWNDVPANVNANKALVNDLDLELNKNQLTWLPWVLDVSPSINDLEKEAIRDKDHLNNVEFITLSHPEEGNYTLKVIPHSLATNSQTFSIAYFITEKDVFHWNFPLKNSKLPANSENYLRWENNKNFPITKIEYTIDNAHWIEISNSQNTSNSYLFWTTPNANTTCQLRALINGTYHLSDEFRISNIITPTVDFNCDEAIRLRWETVPNATSYKVDLMGETFMELYSTTSENSIRISKTNISSPYVAITPVFDNDEGVKGQTINYGVQGVKCYYTNFLAFLKDDTIVESRLNLSTLSDVSSIVFEKISNGETKIIETISSPTDTELIVDDFEIDGGENQYRAKIILDNGSEILTESTIINYPHSNTLKIYPNPVVASDGMFVFSKGDNLTLQIIDLAGRIIYSTSIDKIRKTIPITMIKTGLYFVRLLRNGNPLVVKKIIITP